MKHFTDTMGDLSLLQVALLSIAILGIYKLITHMEIADTTSPFLLFGYRGKFLPILGS